MLPALTFEQCLAPGCMREANSLDRKDTSLLFYDGNCQRLCTSCNSRKGNRSQDVLEEQYQRRAALEQAAWALELAAEQ